MRRYGYTDRVAMLADARAQIDRRLIALPPFQPGFDIVTAPDETLARYGLPSRSERTSNPQVAALLSQALSPQLRRRVVEARDLNVDADYRVGQAQAGSNTGRVGSSTNWSGAMKLPSHARRFSLIAATWTVPVPHAPVNARGAVTDGDYRLSTWIGLDGFFARSASLPQVGTTQKILVSNGSAAPPIYSLWFQWWVRHQKYPVVTFDPTLYPIAGGDEMVAILVVAANSLRVTIIVANLTQAWGAPLQFDGPNEAGLPAVGSTAEWIAERPQSFDPPFDLYPLPDFGQIAFGDCTTAAAHDPPSLSNQFDVRCARRIEMRQSIPGPPHRSAVIARPHPLTAQSFRVGYRSAF